MTHRQLNKLSISMVLHEYLVTNPVLVKAIPEPRFAKIDKKQATDQLVILFNQSDELLFKSDLLVGIVKLNQPIFFAGYKSARAIIDRVGRGLKLKIQIVYVTKNEFASVIVELEKL